MIARICLWSVLAFDLNLAWEIGHVRLYTIWMEADGPHIAWSVLHCSLGDVLIALAVFALAGVASVGRLRNCGDRRDGLYGLE